jgi:glucose-6-phosphate-specific signal transduction histidine kinase
MARSSSIAPTPGWEKGMLVTSLEGLLMYQKNRFFWLDKLVDWEFIQYQTLRSILLAIKIKQLHIARAKSPEAKLIERNKRKTADATGRLLSSKHS